MSKYDAFIDDLRHAGLLLEFTPEQWAAYADRHFGADSTVTFGPPAFVSPPPDPKDTRWNEPQRRPDEEPMPDA